jgi:hypothetical protein
MKARLQSLLAVAAGGAALLGVAVALAAGCGAPGGGDGGEADGARSGRRGHDELAANDPARSAAAWQVVYEVLQHPRCLNCHPAGDAPLQGDASLRHGQNVQRGPDGHGLYALRCDSCHQTSNPSFANLPPGAPNWHLPSPDMPLVFEGLSSPELCAQLKDPARNGHKTPEQLFEHMASDALVGWGWAPGPGRAPVPTPRTEVAAAMRAWIDGGCECPER